MDRSPLSDITNAPPSSPTDTTANGGGSGATTETDQENAEPSDGLWRETCKIAMSTRNWKLMDNNLMLLMFYDRSEINNFDAEALQDFYRAKRNGWLEGTDSSFFSTLLFNCRTSFDFKLYGVRETYLSQTLDRYRPLSVPDNDLNPAHVKGRQ